MIQTSIFYGGNHHSGKFAGTVLEEGRAYQMMDVSQFLSDEKVVPAAKDRLMTWRCEYDLILIMGQDLETIIAIQRASFKAVYEKYQINMTPIWRSERIH